jgi:hypothetical protein
MRVCDVHVEVFASNAIELNNHKIYIKTDELLVPSLAGVSAVEETNTIMKNVVFWDVALCRFCVNRRFGGTYRLHLQGRKIRER